MNDNCKEILLKAIFAGNIKQKEELPWTNLAVPKVNENTY